MKISAYSEEDVLSPAVALSKIFLYQSYFDSSLLQNALLSQVLGQDIISSEDQTITGYSVGLHPSSQTPISIKFNSGSRSERSRVHTLKPGQILTPTGGTKKHAFTGFSWGLPYGWLGGGMATLLVFKTADAEVRWSEGSEVIFHRATYAIKQPADLTLAGSFNNAPNNWPMRFPWPKAAAFAAAAQQQYSQPVLAITPTRVALALRGLTTLAASNTMRLIFQGTNDFALDSAGAIVTTVPLFQDIVWDAWTSLGTSGNLSTQRPVRVLINEPIVRLAADDGGVLFVDGSGVDAVFTEKFVDVVRYGKL